MHETIIIKNFGPVKDIEIQNISPFTVFTGESGSGKSTVMKVVALFRWIYKMLNLRSYLKYANISQSPFNFDFRQCLKNNGLSDYLKPDTDITYKKGKTTIHYKGKLASSPVVPKEELSLEKMNFIADKRNLIPDMLAAKKNDKIPMSFFLEETYNDFVTSSGLVKELTIDYLGVKYFSRETGTGVRYFIGSLNETDNYTINMEDSSSGTQTVVPLSVIIEYFSKHYDFKGTFNNMIFKYLSQSDSLKDFRAEQNIGDIKHKNIHIHIEEPELSLYPESQRNLINFIVNRCFVEKHKDYNMTLMLATHSPYIINHLNLLIKASDRDKPVEGAKIAY
ncbi:MAG: AAA family ATPase, partial [Tannerella sp.]|nr:AAA family ATPase [Tannerella sp.]